MLRNFDSLCYENKIHLLLEYFVIFNKNIQNSNLFLLKKNQNDNCKDQFWFEPRTRMDPGPKSPNNKFVESGRKN